MAREDRLAKIDAVINVFFQLSKSKSFLKMQTREGEVGELATTLHRHLQHFFNKTKSELA